MYTHESYSAEGGARVLPVVAKDFCFPCALRSAIWAFEQCNPGFFAESRLSWNHLANTYGDLGLTADTVLDVEACIDALMFVYGSPQHARPTIIQFYTERETPFVWRNTARQRLLQSEGTTAEEQQELARTQDHRIMTFVLVGDGGHVVIAGRERSPQVFPEYVQPQPEPSYCVNERSDVTGTLRFSRAPEAAAPTPAPYVQLSGSFCTETPQRPQLTTYRSLARSAVRPQPAAPQLQGVPVFVGRAPEAAAAPFSGFHGLAWQRQRPSRWSQH